MNIAGHFNKKLGEANAKIAYEKTNDPRFLDVHSQLDYLALQTTRAEEETQRTKRQADIVNETANQYEEKARRASMFAENNGEISNSGNGSMLSGLTGFAKLRRKVLGSLGSLGSSDEKLGG